ncbi:MAG TPA: type II secretion system protein [Gaiellaceae bacterium]|nr:type II secretion system protein [Gaiellaceae bacterium]
MLRSPRLVLAVTRRLSAQAGYTLVELLVVMALLGVVMGALADGFASASKTETDEVARADDQESAREVLERMRTDIHCASGAEAQPTLDSLGNPTGTGYTLQLSVTQNQCAGVTTGSNGVQWCSVSVGGSTTRYAVYRTTSGNCGPADALFEVDYITSYGSITGGNFWSLPSCSTGRLQAVTVNLPVNRTPVTRPDATYDLTDTIAMRNAPACP